MFCRCGRDLNICAAPLHRETRRSIVREHMSTHRSQFSPANRAYQFGSPSAAAAVRHVRTSDSASEDVVINLNFRLFLLCAIKFVAH